MISVSLLPFGLAPPAEYRPTAVTEFGQDPGNCQKQQTVLAAISQYWFESGR